MSISAPPLMMTRRGCLIEWAKSFDIKDPCVAYDGTYWHIFGSGWNQEHAGHILHMISPGPESTWIIQSPSVLNTPLGKQSSAPGVIYDNGAFHMFLQTEFNKPGGTIMYLNSRDGGNHFQFQNITLSSIPDSDEAGIYDPHPALLNGHKYLTYSGFSKIQDIAGVKDVGQPDIFLAKSLTNTWAGPWERLGKIVSHQDIPFHNQLDHPDYEWGLEGSQLLQLPNGQIVLNAVCYLPEGERGTRQRVFLAVAQQPTGPYASLGPIIHPQENWESGENGHASMIVKDDQLHIFYQGRRPSDSWRYGHVIIPTQEFEQVPPVS